MLCMQVTNGCSFEQHRYDAQLTKLLGHSQLVSFKITLMKQLHFVWENLPRKRPICFIESFEVHAHSIITEGLADLAGFSL